MKNLLQSLALLLIILTTLSCQRDKSDVSSIPHVVIENNNIQGEQDLSRFFNSKTIVVTGEDASKVSGVRTFEYLDGTLYIYMLVSHLTLLQPSVSMVLYYGKCLQSQIQ